MAEVMPDVDYVGFREEWLQEVRVGKPSTTELGHRFAQKLVTQWLEIDNSSEDLVYCDGVVDEYMTDPGEETIFNEPAYVTQFNRDLNGFLKSELLGKDRESSPRFFDLLAVTRKAMGRGSPSPRDVIAKGIRP